MSKMRRTDRAISTEEATRLLSDGEYGVLASVDAEGQPYAVPLNYAYLHNCIYFHCALTGQKLANLADNLKVSFCVVGKTRVLPEQFATEYESVIVAGAASEVRGSERQAALIALLDKYSPEFIAEGKRYIEQKDALTTVIRIEITTLTGKARR